MRTTGIAGSTELSAAAPSAPSRRAALIVLTILFFCSGASALIYQVLWTRVLGWVFGVTVYAASTVRASFMAGLALGSFAAAALGDRARRPLAWFGAAELLIGATALLTRVGLARLQRVYVALYPVLPHSIAGLTAARAAIAFAVLIVPAVLMGATLPLVIKSSAPSERERGMLGERAGVLYASNTAGGIVGTMAAGLYLVPELGIRVTFLVAALLNAVVGVTAIAMSTSIGSTEPPASDAPRPSRAIEEVAGRAPLVVLAVFGASGFASLALEVVWFRVLTLFLRPTVYGFAVMLATILAGIATGSYIVAPWLARRRPWMTVLAVLELSLATVLVLSFRPLARLPALSDWLTPVLSRVAPGWLAFPVAGSLLAILPSSILMGLAFPVGLHVWTANAKGTEIARRIGRFYSLNVSMAIFGSLAAGFVLLPWLGSRTTLIGLGAVSLASGLALLAAAEARRSTRVGIGVAFAAAFGVLAATTPDPFDEFVAQRYPHDRIVWREEGVEATVVVHESPRQELSLTVNGNHQASTDASTVYIHRRIGHLPMAVHPDPRTALVIGLGGGATAGAVSIHGASVDVVELAGSVVRGARLFEAINYGVLHRPNVRLRVDDGRNFLMLTPRRYDVVTADVIHPIFAGSGNLYSAEYFRLVRRVLNPGGMVVQWVAGTEADYKLIARTFLEVFPQTTVWGGGSLLVGMTEPLRLRRSDFERKLASTGSAQGLHDLNVETFDALLAAFDAGPDELRAFVGDGPILTDDRPMVEYFLSLPRDRDVDTTPLKGDVGRYVSR